MVMPSINAISPEGRVYMNTDKISIIVPIYNKIKYLDQCVDSIRNQSHKNLEIILLDDGSTDGSLELCAKYAETDSRVIVMHHDNVGAGATKNRGMAKASGNYIMFVDGDDWLEKDCCKNLLAAIRRYDVDVAICDFMINGKREHQWTEMFCHGDEIIREYLKGNILNRTHNKLYKIGVVSGVDFPIGRDLKEDALWTCMVLSRIDSLIRVSEGYYNYRILPNSLSHKRGQREELISGSYANELEGLAALLTRVHDASLRNEILDKILLMTGNAICSGCNLGKYNIIGKVACIMRQNDTYYIRKCADTADKKLVELLVEDVKNVDVQCAYVKWGLCSPNAPPKLKAKILKGKLALAFRKMRAKAK